MGIRHCGNRHKVCVRNKCGIRRAVCAKSLLVPKFQILEFGEANFWHQNARFAFSQQTKRFASDVSSGISKLRSQATTHGLVRGSISTVAFK